ncbi:MAG: diaminopimelate decarboxylase [Eubacteriales bacterium]
MISFIQQTEFFGNSNPQLLVSEFGTPLYVYNEKILRERMKRMAHLISYPGFTANYSIKTNSNLSILKMALDEGLNADAMSPGEIFLLLKAGFPRERIFYVSNNVSAEELQYAIDQGVVVSLDSLSQLELFGKINRGGRCAVRLNPGYGAGHHEKVITAGKKTKFAISESDVPEIMKIAAKYDLKIIGINQHIGSLFMDGSPFMLAVEQFLKIAMQFKNLEFVDFGGGFGIPYHKLSGEQEFDLESFGAALEKVVEDWSDRYGRNVVFKSEPGRYIAAEGGVILGTVNAKKNNSGIKYIGTDIGMNVLIRPAMYNSWHDIEVFRNGTLIDDHNGIEKVTVVGNICESGDILAKERELPVVMEGDVLCVLDAGAYGYSMSSNYNNRLRPAEVLIGLDGEPKLIRRRDTLEDLLTNFPIS